MFTVSEYTPGYEPFYERDFGKLSEAVAYMGRELADLRDEYPIVTGRGNRWEFRNATDEDAVRVLELVGVR